MSYLLDIADVVSLFVGFSRAGLWSSVLSSVLKQASLTADVHMSQVLHTSSIFEALIAVKVYTVL